MRSASELPPKDQTPNPLEDNDFEVETSVRDNLNTEFFSISVKRLIILSIISFGGYIFYWFYRNWKEIKNSENSQIWPFWRMVLTIIFCYPLFKKVLMSAQSRGYDGSYSPILMTLIYFLCPIIAAKMPHEIIFDIIAVALLISGMIPLIIVQKVINFNNSQVTPDVNIFRKFTISEIIFVILYPIIIIAIGVTYTLYSTAHKIANTTIPAAVAIASAPIPNEAPAPAENIAPIDNVNTTPEAVPDLNSAPPIPDVASAPQTAPAPAPAAAPIPAPQSAPAPTTSSNLFSSASQTLNPALWKLMDVAGKFKVLLPGTPTHDSGDLETAIKSQVIKFDSYNVTIEDTNNYTVFFANVLAFPATFPGGDEAILKQTLDNTTSAVENAKIISTKPASFNGNKATEFLLQADDVWLKGRIVVKGKTAYVLSEGYFEKNYNESDYNKFTNSLVIY